MSPLEQDLIELMLDEVTLEPALGLDRFNNFTFGPPITVQCQVTKRHIRALTMDGRETTSSVQVILADPTVPVSVNDRLTVPGLGVQAIIEVLASSDDKGPYHLEIRA